MGIGAASGAGNHATGPVVQRANSGQGVPKFGACRRCQTRDFAEVTAIAARYTGGPACGRPPHHTSRFNPARHRHLAFSGLEGTDTPRWPELDTRGRSSCHLASASLASGCLALLWQKSDFWDSLGARCVILGEPALMEAGDGRGLAGGPGAVARPVSGSAGQQDAAPDVSCLYRWTYWAGRSQEHPAHGSPVGRDSS